MSAESTRDPHPEAGVEEVSRTVRDGAGRLAEHGSAAELEALLERFDAVPVAEHAALYDQLHRALRARLDTEPHPAPGAPAEMPVGREPRADREPRR